MSTTRGSLLWIVSASSLDVSRACIFVSTDRNIAIQWPSEAEVLPALGVATMPALGFVYSDCTAARLKPPALYSLPLELHPRRPLGQHPSRPLERHQALRLEQLRPHSAEVAALLEHLPPHQASEPPAHPHLEQTMLLEVHLLALCSSSDLRM